MTRPPDAADDLPPRDTSNIRLVTVVGDQQPTNLLRAAQLETAVLEVAAAAGVEGEAMAGLHGLRVQAIRSTERHGR